MVRCQEREEGLQWASLLVPDLELAKELRGQGTRAGDSQSLSMEKSISGPPCGAPSYCEMGNRLCLDVVEIAKYVDVFDEMRAERLNAHMLGEAFRRPLP